MRPLWPPHALCPLHTPSPGVRPSCITDVVCIRITGLHVPQLIYAREGFWINCTYDLESEPLYSIKWFKKNNEVKEEGPWSEIYRYIPNAEREEVKRVFSMRGVVVDAQKSSLGNVFITTADQETEGTYKCEVSADAPTFETVRDERETRLYREYCGSSHVHPHKRRTCGHDCLIIVWTT